MQGVRASSRLTEYLKAANLEFSRLDSDTPIMLNLTQFPLITFASGLFPAMQLEWPRDHLSLDRTVIVICESETFEVETSGFVLRREPGYYVIPPGDTHVTFHLNVPVTEALYVSADASYVSHLAIGTGTPRFDKPVDPGVAAPIRSFLSALTRISVKDTNGIEPLADAAKTVTRSLIDLIGYDADADMGLFARAMQVIVREHMRPELSVEVLASEFEVSTRTLQLAFAAEKTTVTREIRAARTRAALDIRQRNPHLPAKALAVAVGFGSTSALFRGIREFAPSTALLE